MGVFFVLTDFVLYLTYNEDDMDARQMTEYCDINHVTVTHTEREIWTVDYCHHICCGYRGSTSGCDHLLPARKTHVEPKKERVNWKIAGGDIGWKNIHEKISV